MAHGPNANRNGAEASRAPARVVGGESALTRDISRSHRKRAVRATTIATNRMPLYELRAGAAIADAELAEVGPVARPVTRGDCRGGERPCPFLSCAHHLFLDVHPKTGAIKLNFPDLGPEELTGPLDSCALDVADRGGVTVERAGELLNMTRERVRQLETVALAKIATALSVTAREALVDESRGGLPRAPVEAERAQGPASIDVRGAWTSDDAFLLGPVSEDWSKPR